MEGNSQILQKNKTKNRQKTTKQTKKKQIVNLDYQMLLNQVTVSVPVCLNLLNLAVSFILHTT